MLFNDGPVRGHNIIRTVLGKLKDLVGITVKVDTFYRSCEIAELYRRRGIPVIMGILPLRTARHADFLHQKVAGIAVPGQLRELMHRADDTIKTGNRNAREMLAAARERFAGACIMPPFDHYEVLEDILGFDTA